MATMTAVQRSGRSTTVSYAERPGVKIGGSSSSSASWNTSIFPVASTAASKPQSWNTSIFPVASTAASKRCATTATNVYAGAQSPAYNLYSTRAGTMAVPVGQTLGSAIAQAPFIREATAAATRQSVDIGTGETMIPATIISQKSQPDYTYQPSGGSGLGDWFSDLGDKLGAGAAGFSLGTILLIGAGLFVVAKVSK